MKYLLIKYLMAIRKRAWMMALIMLFAMMTSYLMTKYTVPPQFQATTKLIINLKTVTTPDVTINEVMAYQKLVKTYNEIIKSNTVAQEVIDKMGLKMAPEQLAGSVAVAAVNDSQVISVTFTSGDPNLAGRLADEVSLAFMDKVAHMMQVDNVVILDKASNRPALQTKPNPKVNMMMALLLSAIVSIAVLVLREYLDPTLKMRDEVHLILRLPLIGEIGIWNKEKTSKLSEAPIQMLPSKQNRNVLENYNALYRNLTPLNILDELKSVIVTSTVRGEGRSTILTHFGVLLAQSGQRVLLIDADFEHPSLHAMFQVINGLGLAECMTGQATLQQATADTLVFGLHVLPAGSASPAAMRGLGKGAFAELIAEARELYDIVLIDTPSMSDSIIPQTIGAIGDGVMFVAGSGIADRKQAALAVEVMKNSGANMLGAVLNNMVGRTTRPKFFLDRKRRIHLPETAEGMQKTT